MIGLRSIGPGWFKSIISPTCHVQSFHGKIITLTSAIIITTQSFTYLDVTHVQSQINRNQFLDIENKDLKPRTKNGEGRIDPPALIVLTPILSLQFLHTLVMSPPGLLLL